MLCEGSVAQTHSLTVAARMGCRSRCDRARGTRTRMPTDPMDQSDSHAPDGHTHAGVSPLRTELTEHLPFSVSSVALGLIVAGIICALVPEGAVSPTASDAGHEGLSGGPATPLFHLFHPSHTFFSAAATTAMFWRYDRKLWLAVLIGLVGAIGVCGCGKPETQSPC